MKVWLCVASSAGPIRKQLAHNDDVYFAAPGTTTGDRFSPSQAAKSDLCSVSADVDGMQRREYPLAAHEGAASTASMPPGLDESRRLSFHTQALLRHGVALWKNRARGRAWCLRLGMTSRSWDGWAQMHVHPPVAMQFYFLPTIGVMLTEVLLFTGLSMDTNSLLFYAVTVPHALNIPVGVVLNCAMFRFGPQIAFHRMYQPMVLLFVALQLPVPYVGYIGPQDTVPRSRMVTEPQTALWKHCCISQEFAWQCLVLVCELGIVACTLVKLYNLRHPGNAAGEDFSPTQQHSDLGLAFFSLATTLFTFTLNLVGTSKALVAVRSAVARVSHRGFRQCQVTPRTSHTTA